MSKVQKFNGEGGTSDGLFFHAFSGRPVSQYDWPNSDGDPSANLGDVFVLTIRAEVVKVVEDEIKDGRRQTIGFKVIDSKLGNMVAKSDCVDPNQTSIDDVDDDDGDYGDYTPPAYDPTAPGQPDDGVVDAEVIDEDDEDTTVVSADFGPDFSAG